MMQTLETIFVCALAAGFTAVAMALLLPRLAPRFRGLRWPARFASLAVLTAFAAAVGNKSGVGGRASTPATGDAVLRGGDMPAWWRFDPFDTDGDGIPDLWEIWTRGDPLVADSHLDRDGDGLTDLEEFWYQTDPRTASTMCDGLPDGLKISHGYDPLTRETFVVDEPDEDNDGVIDLWQESGYRYGFMDANNNGFDDRYEAQLAMPGDGNADVELAVTTSRSAALCWGGESLVLEAGTWRVGVRVLRGTDTCISLAPAPEGVDVNGPWKVSMSWRWHPGRHGNNTTIRLFDEGREDGFLQGPDSGVEIATILGEPSDAAQGFRIMSTRNRQNNPSATIRYGSVTISNAVQSVCVRHGGIPVFHATVTGAVFEPLEWFERYKLYGIPDGTGRTFRPSLGPGSHRIWCGENGWCPMRADIPHPTPPRARSYADLHVYDCGLSTTDVLGAAMRADHTPTNVLSAATVNDCTDTNLTFYLGFDHAKVATRNLSVITDHSGKPYDEAYQKTEHTIPGLIWNEYRGGINLQNLLADNYLHLPLSDRVSLYFTSQRDAKGPRTEVPDHVLWYAGKPLDMKPLIYHIELRHRGKPGEVFDRLWIVVNRPDTKTEFDRWVGWNTDNTWTTSLPKPFSKITINGNNATAPASTQWKQPEWKSTLLHHNSKFEMLSEVAGVWHRHQAWYDTDGILIETTIAAGRAKKVALGATEYNDNELLANHNKHDIHPFVRAVQLDGNPVHDGDGDVILNYMSGIPETDIYQTFNRPCIYMGDHTDTYLEKRPTLPTGKQP